MIGMNEKLGMISENMIRYTRIAIFMICLLSVTEAVMAQISGKVIDAKTGEPIPYAYVGYRDINNLLTKTDLNGKFTIERKEGEELYVSMLGYDEWTRKITKSTPNKQTVRMFETKMKISEVTVTGKKGKYSRKNNPAVEMMRKVIAAKSHGELTENHDYVSHHKYEKMVLSVNDVTDKVFDDERLKKFSWLKEHVEVCQTTGKNILPIIVSEKVSRNIFRKSPKSQKTIVMGEHEEGINDLVNTGDNLQVMLNDAFTDIDIYKNQVRILQHPFTSPLSDDDAIRFYRFYIVDTLMVDDNLCFHLDFTPNNQQDFGFSGSLYVLADSTWRVKRAEISIPRNSDVNFVEGMDITQQFTTLPTGEQVLTDQYLLIQMKLTDWLTKVQVERTIANTNYDFTPIPDKEFKFSGPKKVESSASMRDEEFWEGYRPTPLTKTESGMDRFVQNLMNIKGFKYVLWVGKAFIENFVETSIDPKHPSKLDFGPVNTTFSQNQIEGFKLRASAQTTANLSPHFFLKGYVGYGFKDRRWKGLGEATYSFIKKDYLPREFPVNNLTASYYYDVIAPSDRFINTDKDNVFTSFKWTPVEHMTYIQRIALQWDREWDNGLRFTTHFRREEMEAAGDLFFQRMNGTATPLATTDPLSADFTQRYLTTSEFKVSLEYQPGATWTNTKQRRLKTNHDTPIFNLSHTTGVKGLMGSDCNYNLTEATIYKRFWMKSWGKIDCFVKGGIQWNKVPFPLLSFPAANLSYIIEDNTFNLIDNMEFMTDRQVALHVSWDMSGKLLNRIPLIRKLKWREYFGVKAYWGMLTDKNNPMLSQNYTDPSSTLMYFPGMWQTDGSFRSQTLVMDKNRPYVELIAGVHNIFKILHVEYVRRLNYLHEGTHRNGIRFMIRMTF